MIFHYFFINNPLTLSTILPMKVFLSANLFYSSNYDNNLFTLCSCFFKS